MMENGEGALVYTNERCQGCNRCISVCPVLTSNYSVKSASGQRIEVHGENCIQCGACFFRICKKARRFRFYWHRLLRQIIQANMQRCLEG